MPHTHPQYITIDHKISEDVHHKVEKRVKKKVPGHGAVGEARKLQHHLHCQIRVHLRSRGKLGDLGLKHVVA